jgi:hypothetical protein
MSKCDQEGLGKNFTLTPFVLSLMLDYNNTMKMMEYLK